MNGEYPGWVAALTASLAMLFLGVRARMLAVPELRTRCSACGRLYWRGTTCRCSRE